MPYAFAGPADLTQLYTGHDFDHMTGQYYAPFRYLSPATGRWMKPDPLGMVDGPNMFRYAGSNPILFLDPLGLRISLFPEDSVLGEFANGAIEGVLCTFDGVVPGANPAEHLYANPDGTVSDVHKASRIIGGTSVGLAIGGGSGALVRAAGNSGKILSAGTATQLQSAEALAVGVLGRGAAVTNTTGSRTLGLLTDAGLFGLAGGNAWEISLDLSDIRD